MKKLNFLLMVLLTSLWFGSTAFAAIIIGRIAHVEGEIYRYMEVDQSWVETFLDSPAGTLDLLATGPDSRAELKFPNNVLIRLDQETELEIVELRENTAVFSLQKGLARFYNHDAEVTLVIETVQGTTGVNPGSATDIKVENETVTVAAVQGQSSFQGHAGDRGNKEIITGSTSLEFKPGIMKAGTGPLDRDWNLWCLNRENTWNQNRVVRSAYLPETMQEYAYVLEPAGRWNRVYYRGYYYWAWRPIHVPVGWAPYTTGYWYDWHDEHVWIDYNPWGWVTHHHGHWLYLNNAWLWTPYVHVSYAPNVTVVGLNIHFGKRYRPHWHPGRVRWISDDSHIGWLPLAPWESYYGHHRWGPRSVVVSRNKKLHVKANLSKHRHIDHAVIISRRDFQHRHPVAKEHYAKVRLRNINKYAIVKNYRPVQFAEERKFVRSAPKVEPKAARLNREPIRQRPKTVLRQETSGPRPHFRKNAIKPASPKKEIRAKATAVHPLQRVTENRKTRFFQKRNQTGRQAETAERAGSVHRTRIRQENRIGDTPLPSKHLSQEQKARPHLQVAKKVDRDKTSQQPGVRQHIRPSSSPGRRNAGITGQQNNSNIRNRQLRQEATPNVKKQKQVQSRQNQEEYSGEYEEIGGRTPSRTNISSRYRSQRNLEHSPRENRAQSRYRAQRNNFSAASGPRQLR